MASSSASSVHKSFKYDVFLSFRGEDTRKNFVDHLYTALQHKSIHTYKDDERIKKGKRISDELIKAIEDSKFYVIVFSKTYASSSWCLDELVKIIECEKTTDHTAYPVFYDVDPTEVRKQIGSVGEAFARHEKEEAAGKWRDALKEAADLAGWELKNTSDGHEAKFIQKIVEEISLELRLIDSSIDGTLVGMETRVKDVVSSLETSIDDVRMLGIKGMGGAGKTTLARSIFDHISIWFDGSSFVENVREKASLKGLNMLQEQVLSDVLNDQSIKVSGVYDGKIMMRKMLCSRKVLVVLDDVDQVGQLEALAGERNWFKPGSRIIITTREEQVLVAHRVNSIHDVNVLMDEEAICLFSRYAFGTETPIQGYKELSSEVVCYAAGLPLTIKVLGSFLCGKIDLEWRDALERLKTIPLKETMDKLELSYNGLEEDYKEIFLDVACIFKGWDKEQAIIALENCGFHARNGLRVLEQKSLVTISVYGCLDMHDHIEEMGKNIVRRLHPNEPHKHSRLWIKEEIEEILANDLGTEVIRCITLWYTELHPAIVMKGLGSMKELRFLYVRNGMSFMFQKSNENNQDIPDADIPKSLRFLCWHGYPLACLPKNLSADNLVRLEMPYSSIVQLWEGQERKVLNKVRFVNLSHSKLRTLDLGLFPNLETLHLEECDELVELDMHFGCQKLRFLKLSHFRALDLGLTSNLETLRLANCEELRFPDEYLKLKYLNIFDCKFRTLHLAQTPNLEMFSLNNCRDLVELHMPVESPKLESLNLCDCKLRSLDLTRAPNLKMLDLSRCEDLEELHLPVESPRLESLKLSDCKLKSLDLTRAPNLKMLNLARCKDLEERHLRVENPKLKSLTLSDCKLKSLDLTWAPNLKMLHLSRCEDLEELHLPVESPKLESLILYYCKLRSLDLTRAPNLEMLDLVRCEDLKELHLPIESPKLKSLTVSHCKLRSLDLAQTSNLKMLHLSNFKDLGELHMPVESPKLEFLKLYDCKLRSLDLSWALNLKQLDLKNCEDLVELCMPVESSKLESLNLDDCKLRSLVLTWALNLWLIDLKNCEDLVELHMPVESLKLKSLNLYGTKLRTLDLGLSPNLEKLNLIDCYLEEFHTPVGCLTKLVECNLSGCIRFKLIPVFQRSPTVGSSDELCLNAESLDICRLHPDNNLPKFKCIYKAHLPTSNGNLEKLISLGMCPCTNLERFSGIALRGLRKLTLKGSIPVIIKDFGQFEHLEELILSCTKQIKFLPDSICLLKHLKFLKLDSCWLLEHLPSDFGRLECLEELYLTDCIFLRDIPNSICEMKSLNYFSLSFCMLVDKLPEEIGQVKCLKELNIEGTGISQLPNSIFGLKGLRIIGSRWRLESYGFTSMAQVTPHSEHMFYCYI